MMEVRSVEQSSLNYDPRGPRPDLVSELLRFEFSKRARNNPNYSLRSFARTLGVSHTLLSLVIGGKRKPSAKLGALVSEKFGLEPNFFKQDLVGSLVEKSNGKIKTQPKEFSLDEFALISEWQHYAILSLLQIPDTIFSPEFIAKRLGISVLLAKVSMQRLFNLKIIEQDKNGKWKQKPGPIQIRDTRSTSSTRKFQKQLLAKAIQSMEEDPKELRDLSSTTFAMDASLVPYALQRIRGFRRELSDELESRGKPNEVYNLTVQIFPTSRRSSK